MTVRYFEDYKYLHSLSITTGLIRMNECLFVNKSNGSAKLILLLLAWIQY